MTRLTSSDLRNLEGSLAAYDNYLRDTTGFDLTGLALDAADLSTDPFTRDALADLRLGVIPITSGLGLVGGFAQSVAAVLNHLGCRSFVTEATDVAGIAEAVARRPAAIFLSDDSDFLAMDPIGGTIVHNTKATAQGFVSALARMADGLADRKVLLLGCGALGRAAAEALLERGARLLLVDRVSARRTALKTHLRERFAATAACVMEADEKDAEADLIFDATNTGNHIDLDRITQRTLVAAPGMPCGITAAARLKLGNRLLHDPLQIGVAAMAAQIFASSRLGESVGIHAVGESGRHG
jgi:3-methylornithyl-N6-L-lysine dehydrogenase